MFSDSHGKVNEDKIGKLLAATDRINTNKVVGYTKIFKLVETDLEAVEDNVGDSSLLLLNCQ